MYLYTGQPALVEKLQGIQPLQQAESKHRGIDFRTLLLSLLGVVHRVLTSSQHARKISDPSRSHTVNFGHLIWGKSGWKWLKVAESGWKWLKVAESGWKWLKVAESAWKWLKVAERDRMMNKFWRLRINSFKSFQWIPIRPHLQPPHVQNNHLCSASQKMSTRPSCVRFRRSPLGPACHQSWRDEWCIPRGYGSWRHSPQEITADTFFEFFPRASGKMQEKCQEIKNTI